MCEEECEIAPEREAMAAPPKLRERERESVCVLSFVWQLCEMFGNL